MSTPVWNTRNAIRPVIGILCGLLVCCGACDDRTADPEPDPMELLTEPIESTEKPPELIFPAAVRTEDASVNTFIDNLLSACAKGQYGLYRLAVASQYDPMAQRHFERAWHAVKQVEIRGVECIYTPPAAEKLAQRPDLREELRHPIYSVHATITLREGFDRPTRELVVLIVKENDEWKLGPPASPAIKHRMVGDQSDADDLVEGSGRAATTAPATRANTR